MDAKEKMKQELREGRLDPERLVDLVVELQQALQQTQRRVAELERKLKGFSKAETTEPYSMRAEEKRRRRLKKRRKPASVRRGRRPAAIRADRQSPA